MTDATEPSPSRQPIGSGDDALLEAMLVSYLECAPTDDPAVLEDFCAERPDLLPALRHMVRLVRQLPGGDRDPLRGRVLGGRYTLTARLGAGAMGLVYAARDEELGREVAVKVLEDIFAADASRVERFRREAQSLAALDSPHIVAVHDVALDAQPPYLVMDRIRGFDLAVWLRDLAARVPTDRLPTGEEMAGCAVELAGVALDEVPELFRKPWPEVVAVLGLQMCKALAEAHEVGVVHRDVKPSNFMLDVQGRLRLLDFGLARRDLDASLTRSRAKIGTPLYMAPEQVRGQEATALADLYSIGATLYEGLCLRPPFDARGSELDSKILFDEPVPPQRLRRRLPGDLQAVCLKALAKTPERRYGSAREMAADLQRFLDYEPVLARPRVLPAPMRAAVGLYRRHRRAAVAVAAVSVLAVVTTFVAAQLFGEQVAAEQLQRARELREAVARIPPMIAVGASLEDRRGHPFRAAMLTNLDRVLEIDPTHVEARFLRYGMLEEEAVVDRAALAADESRLAEALGRARLEALRDVVAQQRARRFDAAAEKLSELDPDGPADAVAARLWLLTDLPRGRFDSAGELIARREREHGITALTSWARGIIALLNRRYVDALDALTRSNELCPHHASTLQALAQTNRKLKAGRRAERFIGEALALLQQPHVNYLDELALCLRDQGRYSEAERVILGFPAAAGDRRSLSLSALRTWQALDDSARREALLDEAEQILEELLREADLLKRYRRLAERNLRTARVLREVLLHDTGDDAERAAERLDVYLELATEDPLRPSVLRELSRFLGAAALQKLPPDTLRRLRGFLSRQIEEIDRLEQAGIFGR